MIRPGRQRYVSVTLAVLAVLVTGCSGSSAPASTPTPSPTVSPSPSPATALSRLARSGVHAAYTALYVLRTPKAHGTELVRRTASRYRVDLDIAGRSRSTLIRTHSGYVACAGRGPGATCGRLASIPPVLNFAQLFTTYLVELSTSRYPVSAAGATSAHGSVPAGACFRVGARPHTTPTLVFPGTYCLSAAGVPTRAVFASRSLTLRRLHVGRPPSAALRPPAKPS